jgi:hypothetical protein
VNEKALAHWEAVAPNKKNVVIMEENNQSGKPIIWS